jgi:hypothetical protein
VRFSRDHSPRRRYPRTREPPALLDDPPSNPDAHLPPLVPRRPAARRRPRRLASTTTRPRRSPAFTRALCRRPSATSFPPRARERRVHKLVRGGEREVNGIKRPAFSRSTDGATAEGCESPRLSAAVRRIKWAAAKSGRVAGGRSEWAVDCSPLPRTARRRPSTHSPITPERTRESRRSSPPATRFFGRPLGGLPAGGRRPPESGDSRRSPVVDPLPSLLIERLSAHFEKGNGRPFDSPLEREWRAAGSEGLIGDTL